MASTSETPFWIKFFTTAGIPAGDAAHYAIMFSDNRITKDMLLDLSKEYLTDMGIARLGDVIAILKHAKHVHQEEATDKLLKSSPYLTTSTSPASTPRRSTAASRMINHFTSKHPEAAPMSQQPVPRPPPPDPPQSLKRKVSVFDRLGAEGNDSNATVTVPQTISVQAGNNVFSRLGGKSEATKRPFSGLAMDEVAATSSGDSLPYAGVLKSSGSPSPAKKARPNVSIALKAKNLRIKKTIKQISSPDPKASNIQRPEISTTTTAGVLSDFAKKDAPSLRDRLGAKHESPVISSTTSRTPTAVKRTKVGVQARLGAKKTASSSPMTSPVVSSTQQLSEKLKGFKTKSLQSKQPAAKPKGIFSRLGKKSKA